MRKLLILLLFLTFTIPAQAQFWLWGKKANSVIEWGNSFTRTDSLKLRGSAATVLADSNYLYTSMLPIADNVAGTYNLTFSADSSDAPSDSLYLDLRFYYDKNVHLVHYWGAWKNIGGKLQSDLLYIWQIADSSWWGGCTGMQFRTYKIDAGADTLLVPGIGPYIN